MLRADGFVDRLGADRIHGNVQRAVEAQLRTAVKPGSLQCASISSRATSIRTFQPRFSTPDGSTLLKLTP